MRRCSKCCGGSPNRGPSALPALLGRGKSQRMPEEAARKAAFFCCPHAALQPNHRAIAGVRRPGPARTSAASAPGIEVSGLNDQDPSLRSALRSTRATIASPSRNGSSLIIRARAFPPECRSRAGSARRRAARSAHAPDELSKRREAGRMRPPPRDARVWGQVPALPPPSTPTPRGRRLPPSRRCGARVWMTGMRKLVAQVGFGGDPHGRGGDLQKRALGFGFPAAWALR